jgi:undecaprenyl-diphosphatase
MIERLDQQLFLYLNSFHSPFWDQIMWLISTIPIWIPMYIAILTAIGLKYKRKIWVLVVVIIIAVTLSDQGSVAFKRSFHRLRPCHEPALNGLVHTVKGKCGGNFGFLSSHAANAFNVALLSLLLLRRRWFTYSILFWASIVSYSRIYLGVHYPGDVVCGSILGALIGWGVYKLYKIIDEKYLNSSRYFNPVYKKEPDNV